MTAANSDRLAGLWNQVKERWGVPGAFALHRPGRFPPATAPRDRAGLRPAVRREPTRGFAAT